MLSHPRLFVDNPEYVHGVPLHLVLCSQRQRTMMASPLPAQSSRASSPMSTISDLDPHRHQDSKTFDDLTLALANFSRAQTPDAPAGCCCMRENCESMRTWADVRAKLESRLVLSAGKWRYT